VNAQQARAARHATTQNGRGYKYIKHHYKMQRRLAGPFATVMLFDARAQSGLRAQIAAACRHLRKLTREGSSV